MLKSLVDYCNDNQLHEKEFVFWEDKEVQFIHLDHNGELVSPYITESKVPVKKPNISRSSGVNAILLSDGLKYVLGLTPILDKKYLNVLSTYIPKIESDKDKLINADKGQLEKILETLEFKALSSKNKKDFLKLIKKEDILLNTISKEAFIKTPVYHQAFLNRIDDFLQTYPDNQYALCVNKFLKNTDLKWKIIKDLTLKPIVFKVNNVSISEEKDVLDWWYELLAKQYLGSNEKVTCLVCGKLKPPVRINPRNIKLPGGQSSGNLLISFNVDSFESYGSSQNRNAPICLECSLDYTKTLNYLIDHTRKDKPSFSHNSVGRKIGESFFLAWSEEKSINSIFDITDPPAKINLLLKAPFINTPVSGNFLNFHSLIIKSNASRIIVQAHNIDSIEIVKGNLLNWYKSQQLDSRKDDEGFEYTSLNKILFSLKPAKAKKWDYPSELSVALLKYAYYGKKIQWGFLNNVLIANRKYLNDIDKKGYPNDNHIRLINIIMNSNNVNTTPGLNPDNPSIAYQSGRLFATIAYLQFQAIGETNANIITKYYSLASTRPQIAFSQLAQQANKYIKKISREKPGLAINADKEMAAILDKIPSMPNTFDLKQQSDFVLGFYHQRTAKFKK